MRGALDAAISHAIVTNCMSPQPWAHSKVQTDQRNRAQPQELQRDAAQGQGAGSCTSTCLPVDTSDARNWRTCHKRTLVVASSPLLVAFPPPKSGRRRGALTKSWVADVAHLKRKRPGAAVTAGLGAKHCVS